MNYNDNPWKIRFERERKARKESESLLEKKSYDLWNINQNLEKKIAQRTKSLEEALIKAEKADRAKSDFLANISHEIRTPLNAIIGFSNFLTKSDELGEKNKKYSSIISTSAESLLEIINDILDFSKIESGKFELSKEDFDLYLLFENIKELFSYKSGERNISLVFDYDKNIPQFINCDALRLKQILTNLLSNAIKFTNEGGSVYFKSFLEEKDEQKVKIKFEVEDTGIGIQENRLQNIFKPFVQLQNIANKQYKGTGLGLSICSNILTLLDSKLNVKSELNKGTVFDFVLEVEIAKQTKTLETFIKIEKENSLVGMKILLAEDNLGNQELMKLIFDEMNIEYDIASDGQEAYEFYIKNNNFYDLILMDVNMPRLNGIESLFLIRNYQVENSLKKTPIIALTANAIKGDKERFLSLGMDDYISKPINQERLKEFLIKYYKKNKDIKTIISIPKIIEKLGVNEKIALMLIDKFKNDITNDILQLEGFINDNNIAEISSKAHYIKNSCLNLCLDDACEILEKLENKNLRKEEKRELFLEFNTIIETIK